MFEEHDDFLRKFYKNKLGVIGAVITIFVILLAVFAPLLTPYSPVETNRLNRREPPGKDFVFGTDNFGRDIFTRIIYGSRISLLVGFISVGIGMLGGLILGLIAGYYSNFIDNIIMWFMDLLMSFPVILLALVIISILGPDLRNTMIAIGIVYIPRFTRLSRASVMEVRDVEYVESARALGNNDFKIITRHILPNILAPIIVQAALALSGAILVEASLSFIGLGIQPPTPSWGTMLNDGRRYMELAPWSVIFPSLAIMITVFGINIFGDGLRDILDPKLR
ncbi:MAG: ABC transporter permease [Halanaerobiales bacterium]